MGGQGSGVRRKTCAQCKGEQIVKTSEGLKPCPALAVTMLGRFACRLPDGTFETKKDGVPISNAKMQKDKAYDERNKVVALIAQMVRCYGGTAGTKRTPIDGWNPEWFGCVYIDLPVHSPTPGIGGKVIEHTKIRINEPLKGQPMGTFKISEVDRDLLDVEWYPVKSPSGVVYWKRQHHLEEPNGLLHRVIAHRIWGDLPDGIEVDHIDRNPSNCSRENLRLATRVANSTNQDRSNTPQKLVNGQWKGFISVEGVKYTDHFQTEEQAIRFCEEKKKWFYLLLHSRGDFVYPPLQVSWHFHDSQEHLFKGLPPYAKNWDGHDNPQKYKRLARWADEWIPPTKDREQKDYLFSAIMEDWNP